MEPVTPWFRFRFHTKPLYDLHGSAVPINNPSHARRLRELSMVGLVAPAVGSAVSFFYRFRNPPSVPGTETVSFVSFSPIACSPVKESVFQGGGREGRLPADCPLAVPSEGTRWLPAAPKPAGAAQSLSERPLGRLAPFGAASASCGRLSAAERPIAAMGLGRRRQCRAETSALASPVGLSGVAL